MEIVNAKVLNVRLYIGTVLHGINNKRNVTSNFVVRMLFYYKYF